MTQPTVPDPFISPILTGLRDCLCNILNEEPWTPVSCGCCIRHSAGLPAMDACDQAWVRFAGISPAPTRKRACPGLSVARFQLGIYRCVDSGEVINGTYVPPSCEVQINESLLFARDAAAMRRAVICCDALEDKDPIIVGWEPVGPQGGCAGGVLTVEATMNMWAPALA